MRQLKLAGMAFATLLCTEASAEEVVRNFVEFSPYVQPPDCVVKTHEPIQQVCLSDGKTVDPAQTRLIIGMRQGWIANAQLAGNPTPNCVTIKFTLKMDHVTSPFYQCRGAQPSIQVQVRIVSTD